MSEYESYFRTGRRIKILIVGDSNVGKTSLITQFVSKSKRSLDNDLNSSGEMSKSDTNTSDRYEPTIQGNVYKARFSLNSKEFTLTIADMPGSNRDEAIRKTREFYYSIENTIDVILLCFSLVDFISFSNLTLNWLPEIKRYFKDVPILLVGTKSDLKQDQITKILHNQLKFSAGSSLGNECNESNLTSGSNTLASSHFVYPPTPPDNSYLNFSSFAKDFRSSANSTPPNSPNMPPPKPLRSSNVLSKGANSRILTSNLFNLQIRMENQDMESSIVSDDEESTILGRNDCLKLKDSIQAVSYLECSAKDTLSLITMFNCAIITGAKFYFQKKKSLDQNKRSSWSSDDNFVLIDYHQEISFMSDTTMVRRLSNFYTVQIMNNALKNEETLNKSLLRSSLSPKNSRKNVQFKINDISKNRNKFFDFFSIFKCHTRCNRSETILSINNIHADI